MSASASAIESAMFRDDSRLATRCVPLGLSSVSVCMTFAALFLMPPSSAFELGLDILASRGLLRQFFDPWFAIFVVTGRTNCPHVG